MQPLSPAMGVKVPAAVGLVTRHFPHATTMGRSGAETVGPVLPGVAA